ncbi:MAG: hypothetical protein CFE26_00995 [Verrucomicrobiales bacterium VVV1]|nr:MAG: hypothetical protein CFE26_00995 [Verrucomicrobiales bacterium VVV1]
MKPSSLAKILGAACLAAPSILLAVPTQIAQESFEGSGIGFTTSVPQFIEVGQGNLLSDYFSIIPNNGTKVSGNRTLPGADGASIFAAEDCDTPRTAPAAQGPQEVTLTTNSVNIAGKINTQVRLLMAAPGRQDLPNPVDLNQYDNADNAPLFINKLKVEASIDGGAFQRVVQFSPNLANTINTTLTFDADGNNVGGDINPIPTNPTTLDATFREGIYSIPTGNSVQIRVTLLSDATGELIAFDNIRIFGETAATNPPAIAGVPAGNLIFTEGDSATAIAPALTVADTDSANLASASVVISQGLSSSEDILSATPSGALLAGNIVYTSATGTLAITGSAPLADYQAVLRSVSYRNSNTTNPSTSVRRVTFAANDGVNPSNSPIRDINIVDNIALQSVPFIESFETDGRGTRYSVDGGFSSPPSLFARTASAASGVDGSTAWGVENVDDNPDPTELITFRVAGGGATGELRVAAGSGSVYDNTDFLRVEISADGAPFQNVLAFHSDAAAQGAMRQDTTPADSNNVGDGTLLTSALQTFSFNVPSGNELVVRIRAFTNIVGENILFDRLVINGPPPPTVTGISPTSGSTVGGTSVTISGTNLSGATGVTIRGVAATSLSANTATSITCITPPGTAGTASVLVTTPAGTNAANTLFTYIAPVVLTCPTNTTTAACQTQAPVNTAFATWLASASASGGSNGVLTNNNTGAPSACGGSTTVTFTYTSTCAPLTTTCQATFTVPTLTPTVTVATTNEDTQTTSGLVIAANAADNGLTTHYQITGITAGTLFKNDGATAIASGSFITKAEGAAGLKFTPDLNLNSTATPFFGFTAQGAIGTTAPADLGASVVVPLPAHFADVELNTLTFTVSGNSVPAKASASITGGTNVTVNGLANGITNITIQADDSNMGLVTDTFQVAVGTTNPTALQLATASTLNRQNGLFELTVNVTNTTPLPINGFRLRVDFASYLAAHPSLRLYNASSPPGTTPVYVDYPYPVAVDSVIPVKLSFYTSTRTFPNPFAPVLSVEALPTSAVSDTNGAGVQPRFVPLTGGNVLLEFPSIPGRWYRVRYSHDMVNWFDSPVPIQASNNRMQWIDNGAPFTISPPSSVPSRFYRVNEITVVPAP